MLRQVQFQYICTCLVIGHTKRKVEKNIISFFCSNCSRPTLYIIIIMEKHQYVYFLLTSKRNLGYPIICDDIIIICAIENGIRAYSDFHLSRICEIPFSTQYRVISKINFYREIQINEITVWKIMLKIQICGCKLLKYLSFPKKFIFTSAHIILLRVHVTFDFIGLHALLQSYINAYTYII